MMQVLRRVLAGCLVFLSCSATNVFARNFSLPTDNQALIGQSFASRALQGDTVASIAQRFNLGVNSILAANPGLDENHSVPAGKVLHIPAEFLLPPLQRVGIVINLPEMRLYYFHPEDGQLMTFPIGIGKIGKTIPIIRTSVVRKKEHPVWIPPDSIRRYNEEQGIELPKVVPAGPDNPLGPFAIYLRVPTYLIHSTIFPESIGRRASFGCIRMNEGDIEQFFPLVKAGTPVEIIDMPNKIAWNENKLYLESYPPLEERNNMASATLKGIIKTIGSRIPLGGVTLIDWQLVSAIADQPDGIPHEIGFRTTGWLTR